jgi:hypothetical protein
MTAEENISNPVETNETNTFEFKVTPVSNTEESTNWKESSNEESSLSQESEKEYFILDETPLVKSETKSGTLENNSENDGHISAEEMQKRNADRMSRISELSKKLKSSGGLNDLENEPAYKRRNISLKDLPHSSESQVSKFTISEDGDGNNELRSNNSFLHDNVD